MGYQSVTEAKLQELQAKHRPAVIAAIDERSKELRIWRDSQGLVSKLYGFKQDPGPVLSNSQCMESLDEMRKSGASCLLECGSTNVDELICSLTGETDSSTEPDLQEQVFYGMLEGF